MHNATILTRELLQTTQLSDLPWEKQDEGQDFCQLEFPGNDNVSIHIRRVKVNAVSDEKSEPEVCSYTLNLANKAGGLVEMGTAANGKKLLLVPIKDDAELKQWLEALLSKAEEPASAHRRSR